MSDAPPHTVHVALEANPYDIHIGTGILSGAGTLIGSQVHGLTHAVVIADANVMIHAQRVESSLEAAGVRTDRLEVPSGESSKSVAMAERLWQALLDRNADRKTLIVAVGGGVVGDLAGFAAATYGRGLSFCQIPTTLLAHVDSSVGGKTGINLPAAKNMVGCFWQPCMVLIDTEVLSTLADREYTSGLAEVVKYGVIMDADFFEQLESSVADLNERDPATLRSVVSQCCRLKADVVEADERETSGRRAILNYGHTFAHAIESVGGYGALLHGEAVSIGMICASRLAQRLGRVGAAVTDRQLALLKQLNLPVVLPDLDHQALWAAMWKDKKVSHGKLRFVLPDRLGNVELVGDVPEADVLAALAETSA